MGKRIVYGLAVAVVSAALLHGTAMAARGADLTEYDVKAAFLYNFAKFVEWPAQAFERDGTMRLCILGEDPFGTALDRIVDSRPPQDRKLVVRRVGRIPNGHSCHILFISSSESARVDEILDQTKGNSVLTVGDTTGYSRRGVVINLVVERNKVRFDVNLHAADQANLKISSKLLKLASTVRGKPSQGGTLGW